MTPIRCQRLHHMLIIAGHLIVDPAHRDAYVVQCAEVVTAARRAQRCLDFSISADIVDQGRVCIFERWEDDAALMTFRGSGPSDDQQSAIVDADVRRYEISTVGDA